MRTTLALDEDVFKVAKSLAQCQKVSLGHVISDLARRGLQSQERVSAPKGFPMFNVSPKAQPLTPEDVRSLDDET
jgi:hypothetical protein